MEVLWTREETLQAVKDEIEGNESEAEAMVAAYKQKVIDIQWALAERGPKVEELLSKPLARETFTPEAMTSMFSALDRPPDHIKAQILSDILRLERAQLGVRAGGGVAEGSEVEATKVTRELLEFWGPVQAKVYWDVMVGFPGEFRSVSEDQVARFASLLA